MLGMLGGLGIGSKIAIGMGVLLVATMAASAWYFNYSQDKLAEANQQVAAQMARAESAEANLQAMRDDVAEQTAALNRLTSEMAENRRAAQNLEDTFAEHDLNALVNAKPNLVERRVNEGTQEVLERIERITDPNSYNPQFEEFVQEEED